MTGFGLNVSLFVVAILFYVATAKSLPSNEVPKQDQPVSQELFDSSASTAGVGSHVFVENMESWISASDVVHMDATGVGNGALNVNLSMNMEAPAKHETLANSILASASVIKD
ncbi:unnamed protein product [Orchesella dallaii]|uniref:Uncharacterized protein n=1 Tax=Orchesella dallaii TaxID=48710 RepID=A0ABP1Q3N3_9HEXA